MQEEINIYATIKTGVNLIQKKLAVTKYRENGVRVMYTVFTSEIELWMRASFIVQILSCMVKNWKLSSMFILEAVKASKWLWNLVIAVIIFF